MIVVFKEYHTVHIDKEKGQDKPDLFSARDDILSSMSCIFLIHLSRNTCKTKILFHAE